jgi:hypothetical protein
MTEAAFLDGTFPGRQVAPARPAGGALPEQVELTDITVNAAGTGGHLGCLFHFS